MIDIQRHILSEQYWNKIEDKQHVFIMLAAVGNDGTISKNGKIPWHCKEDLKMFKELTVGHTVVMGHNTYKSIGRPLPDRLNIVCSLKEDDGYKEPNLYFFNPNNMCYGGHAISLSMILRTKLFCDGLPNQYQPIPYDNSKWAIKLSSDLIFVIGGHSIYRQFMGEAQFIMLTRIDYKGGGDVKFPEISDKYSKPITYKIPNTDIGYDVYRLKR